MQYNSRRWICKKAHAMYLHKLSLQPWHRLRKELAQKVQKSDYLFELLWRNHLRQDCASFRLLIDHFQIRNIGLNFSNFNFI